MCNYSRKCRICIMTLKTIVFIGPSAVGKTYAANLLLRKYPKLFEQAKLYTTREPRSSEVASDRIFVSAKEFENMTKLNKFIISDEFGGNFYGFTIESLYPKKKHLLVNAWPWLSRQMSELDHVMIIGLQAPPEWEEKFTLRMKRRGDKQATIKKRKLLIEKDIEDLKINNEFILKSGYTFTVKDDNTVPEVVIPWIEKRMNIA